MDLPPFCSFSAFARGRLLWFGSPSFSSTCSASGKRSHGVTGRSLSSSVSRFWRRMRACASYRATAPQRSRRDRGAELHAPGLMLRALGDYACLTICPSNLHMERSVIDPRMFRSPGTWSDHLALNLSSLCRFVRRSSSDRRRAEARPWTKFANFRSDLVHLWILPISNLFDLNATSAEHWLYLPLAGLLLVFLGWMIELPPRAFRVASVCGLVFAAALGVRSTIRSTDWINAQVFTSGQSPRTAGARESVEPGEHL